MSNPVTKKPSQGDDQMNAHEEEFSKIMAECFQSMAGPRELTISEEDLRPKRVEDTFPWPQLPDGMSTIVYDWKEVYGLQPLYSLAAMLAAASSALGNRLKLRLTDQWSLNAALWIMTIGEPGTGKSSPINTAFRPVNDYDAELRDIYRAESKEYVAKKKEGNPPVLKQIVLSDFTPESLWHEHGRNQSGIAVVVDELKGLFDSANRYNQGALISQLLTAYTGGSIKITRKGEELPTLIEDTCVSIYGTMQPSILYECMTKTLLDNGFFDRWLIMWPDYKECRKWHEGMFYLADGTPVTPSEARHQTFEEWKEVMNLLLKMGHKSPQQNFVCLSTGAIRFFTNHHNKLVGASDNPDTPQHISNRKHKQGVTVAKLALTIEALNRALHGFDCVEEVSERSMICAIDIYNWFEKRAAELILQQPEKQKAKKAKEEAKSNADDDLMQLLSLVPLKFSRADLQKVGREELKIGRSSIDYLLKHGKDTGMIATIGHGSFTKTDLYIDLQLDMIK